MWTSAQGASAELVGAGLIATAGFTGLPVGTTHVITSGTMLASVAGGEPRDAAHRQRSGVHAAIKIAVAAGLFHVLTGRP